MKKKTVAALLAAALIAAVLAGCGGSDAAEDTAKKAETKEEQTQEEQDQTEVLQEEEDADAAAIVQEAPDQAAAALEGGTVSLEELTDMLSEIAMLSTDPCATAAVTEIMSYDGAYLYALGKDKAPEHPLTKLGENLYQYTSIIQVDKESYNSEEAEAALAAVDEVVDGLLTDEAAIAAQAEEFYNLVK